MQLKDSAGRSWQDGTTLGLHSKHFIVDDKCAYIGSQNLYVCDLAEAGIIIDDEQTVKQFMEEYWNPMWSFSYTGEDYDVQKVMDGLTINHNPKKQSMFLSPIERYRQMLRRASLQTPTNWPLSASLP